MKVSFYIKLCQLLQNQQLAAISLLELPSLLGLLAFKEKTGAVMFLLNRSVKYIHTHTTTLLMP